MIGWAKISRSHHYQWAFFDLHRAICPVPTTRFIPDLCIRMTNKKKEKKEILPKFSLFSNREHIFFK